MKIEYVAISRMIDRLTEKFFYITKFENNSGTVTGEVILLSTFHDPLKWIKTDFKLSSEDFELFYREEKGEVELL